MRLALLALLLFSLSAFAQEPYPGRHPITVVVAYPPAGGTDILARLVLAEVEKKTKWTIVVENKGGATGVIGTTYVAQAKPDGYTLLMGHVAPNAIDPGRFLQPPERFEWNLAPIGLAALAPSLLLARSYTGIVTPEDAKRWIKEHRPTIYGSDGIGSLAHLHMTTLLGGAPAVHVPYRGGGPAINGFLAGDVPIMFSPLPVAIGNLSNDKLRVVAQTYPALPGVPVLRETGGAALWWGLFAPAGTPRSIIERWNKALNEAVITLKPVLAERGYSVRTMTPVEFDDYVRNERKRWSSIVDKVVQP